MSRLYRVFGICEPPVGLWQPQVLTDTFHSRKQSVLRYGQGSRAPWQMARKVSHSRTYSARDTLDQLRPSQSATISMPNTHSRLP